LGAVRTFAGVTEPPRRPEALPSAVAAAVVFGASAAVLILEILALRLLAPYVGVTLETSTTVIGVVLAGIATGAALGGRLADLVDARALLAWALIVGGVLAMLTVPVVRLLGRAMEGGGDLAALPVGLFALFPPAAVLSVVTPATAKLQLSSLANTGSVVGRLSAWATSGALVGTFGAGFLLVPLLPTSETLLGVGAALVVAGTAAAARHRQLGRRGRIVVLILVVTTVAATRALGQPCDSESIYFCARVLVDDHRSSGRLLVLDDLTHSYVDLDNPRYLGLEYSRWVAPVLDHLPAAGDRLRAVFLGAGGLTLPRYLLAGRPRAVAHVLEVDKKLIDLDRARLGFRDRPGIKIRTGDARVTLRDERDSSADVVVGDAFGGRAVPWHLTTEEFLTDVRRVLRPGGVYVMNVIDLGPLNFARAEAATLLSVFRDVALVARADGNREPRGGNLVLLASDRPLRRALLPAQRGIVVLDRSRVRAFAGDSEPLTDDHAPADQLLTPGARN
jgi:spermidine synthase